MLLLVNLIFTLILTVHGIQLPSEFKRCHINSPDVNECLRINIEDAIKQLKNGSQSLAIPPLDPLSIPVLNIGQGNGPVSVEQNFKNLELSGLTDSEITKYVGDFKNLIFHVESLSPKLQILGDYNMHGQLLLLPVTGNGRCNITLVKSKIHHTLTGKMISKKGVPYVRLLDYKVSINPERVFFHFENLLEGDKQLAAVVNNMFQENWKDIYEDVRSSYEETFGLIFLSFGKRVYRRVPFYDIYLQ